MLPEAPDPTEADLLDISSYEQQRCDGSESSGARLAVRRKMSLSLRPKLKLAYVSSGSDKKPSGSRCNLC